MFSKDVAYAVETVENSKINSFRTLFLCTVSQSQRQNLLTLSQLCLTLRAGYNPSAISAVVNATSKPQAKQDLIAWLVHHPPPPYRPPNKYGKILREPLTDTPPKLAHTPPPPPARRAFPCSSLRGTGRDSTFHRHSGPPRGRAETPPRGRGTPNRKGARGKWESGRHGALRANRTREAESSLPERAEPSLRRAGPCRPPRRPRALAGRSGSPRRPPPPNQPPPHPAAPSFSLSAQNGEGSYSPVAAATSQSPR